MILIISYHGDTSTVEVCKWLRKYNTDVYRINFRDFVDKQVPVSLKLNSGKKQTIIDNIVLDDKSLKNTTVWLRKYESKIAPVVKKN